MDNNQLIPTLQELEFFPYLTNEGLISEDWQGKIGVYGIFDQTKTLQFVGYSRDIYASLKQHLVRQFEQCYWLKVYLIPRPSRTLLADIRSAWLEERGMAIAPEQEAIWTEPIDAKLTMTETEKNDYAQTDDLGQIKLLKGIARRVEAEILDNLKERGVTMAIRFNPKLKEQGLLDLK
ncbi:MAG: GIY-YIG nuclease family protein [Microcystaceae cyanobacterium]